MQLVKQILFQARSNPSQPAIAMAGGIITYGTLAGMVGAAVSALETLSLPTGTAVILDIRNPVQHTAAILALALLGLPSASVGSSLALDKLGITPGLFLTDREDAADIGITSYRVGEAWFAFDATVPPPYARLLALPDKPRDSVVRYVFSSGTTGVPKCVALTETVLERRVLYTGMTVLQGRSGAGLNMLGFSTIAGIMAPLITLPVGMLLCFSSSNEEALQMIRIFNISMLSLAVVQLAGFIKALGDQPPPASLQLLSVSGARIPPRLMQEARARLCSNILTGYGSTEMGSMTGGNSISLGLVDGSVGYVRPWVELQAVDQNDQPVPPGSDGILRARSPEMASYAASGADTFETIRDGWFYPGDVGRVFPDGLVVVTGRTNDVINQGGVIVAPEIVEEEIRLHPSVRDVAVVGVPVAGIEEIWAAIVSDEDFDPNAISAAVFPKLNEKTPSRIFRVAQIPKGQGGKVSRQSLRQLLLSRVAP